MLPAFERPTGSLCRSNSSKQYLAAETRITALGWIALIAGLGLQWGTVLSIGPLSVQPMHIGMFVFLAACLPFHLASLSQVSLAQPVFIVGSAYLLLLMSFVISYVLHGESEQIFPLARYFLFLLIFVFVSIVPVSAATIRKCMVIATLALVLALEISAWRVGRSFVIGLPTYLARFDFAELTYEFIRPIFNAFSAEGEVEFRASLRNSISASILVLLTCTLLSASWSMSRTWKSVLSIIAMIQVVVLFVFFSRSGILCLFVIMLALVLSKMMRAPERAGVLFILPAVLALYTLLSVTAVGEYSWSRIVTDNAAYLSRLEQYEYALLLIDRRPLTGSGYVLSEGGFPIHNLILSAWASAGLLGLLFALIMYLYVAGMSVAVVLQSRLFPEAPLIASLAVLFLVRTLISGSGGFPAAPELVALGLMFNRHLWHEYAAMRRSGIRN